jgi:hypothetical protein
MLAAIEFDHQTTFLAAEIRYVVTDRKLPAEFETIQLAEP